MERKSVVKHAFPWGTIEWLAGGEVECRIGAATETLGAGGHAVVPRGSVHSIRNRSASPAELVLGYSAAVREFALAQ